MVLGKVDIIYMIQVSSEIYQFEVNDIARDIARESIDAQCLLEEVECQCDIKYVNKKMIL